jgi:hypothetical protein
VDPDDNDPNVPDPQDPEGDEQTGTTAGGGRPTVPGGPRTPTSRVEG